MLIIFSSIEIFKNNILFGVGQRNFRYACEDIKDNKNTIDFLNKNNFIDKKNFLNNICTTHPHTISIWNCFLKLD